MARWAWAAREWVEGYYSTLVWQPGEYISDERRIQLPEGVNPVGSGYRLVIGIYNSVTGERVPVTVDGQPGRRRLSWWKIGSQILAQAPS